MLDALLLSLETYLPKYDTPYPCIIVRNLVGRTYTFKKQLYPLDTVMDLKRAIRNEDVRTAKNPKCEGLPENLQRLIFHGKILYNHEPLGIVFGHRFNDIGTVHLILRYCPTHPICTEWYLKRNKRLAKLKIRKVKYWRAAFINGRVSGRDEPVYEDEYDGHFIKDG